MIIKLIILVAELIVIYYLLKYNSNFLKQIQSIKGIQFDLLEIGQEAPPFRVLDRNGKRVISKHVFERQHTLLLFIHTKCPKCKTILESLGKIESHYDINIMLINGDEMSDDQEIIKSLSKSIIYIRATHLPTTYLVQNTPTAMIIEKGIVRNKKGERKGQGEYVKNDS